MSELKKTNEKIFQLGSSNLENLRIALLEFNKLNKIEIHKSGNFLVVHFSKDVKLEDISNFLSGKDVFLTHFIEQQFTLEEKFIEILKK